MTKYRSLFSSFEHYLFRASAGTGKTYQLSNRFLELLFADASPEDILATTFTRKAAGEILNRVLLRLALASSNDSEREQLRAALKLPNLSRDRCRKILAETLRSMHRLRVSTLDAFFLQVAGAYGWELNFPPGWTIGEELQDRQLRDDAIDEILNDGDSARLLTLFHLLTKGATTRAVANLVAETVKGLYSVFLETKAAAWQQVESPPRLTDERLDQILSELQQYPAPSNQFREGIDSDIDRFVNESWIPFFKTGIAKKVMEEDFNYYKKPIPADLVALYRQLIQHAYAEIVGRVADQTKATYDLLADFHQAYEARKDDQRILRFEDVTRRLSEATNLPAGGTSFRMNGRIEHLLLDEFQDTSLAQWQVLRPFARQASSGGSLFVVGDTKQAIYGWRGGLAEIFDALKSEFPSLQERPLSKSFRSSPVIMDVVNNVFEKIASHPRLDKFGPTVQAWQHDFPHHSTERTTYPGYACIEVSPAVADGENKDEVHFQFAAERIAEAVRRAPGRSIGVLCRKNAAIARMIFLLRRLGIPASEEGGNALDDSAPVEVILSLLKIIDHPGDTVARFHVAHSPLAEAVGLIDWKSNSRTAKVAARLRRELLEQGYGPLVLSWARQLAPASNERDRNRLQQLVEQAYDFQTNSTLRTTDFIDSVRTTRVSDPIPVDVRVMTIHQAKGLEFDIVFLPELSDRLRGQTPQFVVGRPSPTEPIDIVCRYIAEEAQQLLPPRLQKLFEDAAGQDVQQSLCTLYVSLTRAIHALHMIVPPSSNKGTLSATTEGVLRWTLCDGKPYVAGTKAFEAGDPDWMQHAKLPVSPQPEAELPRKIELAPLEGARKRGWQRVAPSQLEGLWPEETSPAKETVVATKEPAAGPRVKWTDLFGRETSLGMCRGTLFHAWYELVEWLEDGPPPEKTMRRAADGLAAEIGPLSEQVPNLQADFLQTLSRPKVAALLKKAGANVPAGGTLHVEREFPFALRVGSDLVQGIIDRLVLTRVAGKVVAAHIIDFKTDTIAPPGDAAALQGRVDFYRPQVAAYSKAVQQIFHLRPEQVTQQLAFVSADAVVPL